MGMINIFIRWKQKGSEKYAYLETRYRDENGKIRGKSRYLGKDPKTAISKMAEDGEIPADRAEAMIRACEGKYNEKKSTRREKGLCAINTRVELFIVLEILAQHWSRQKDNKLAMVAREIVIAAGKLDEYHRHWAVLADRGIGVYEKWSGIKEEIEMYKTTGMHEMENRLAKILEEYEGEIILSELI